MKLNNNGWGLRVAIAFIAMFTLCLIVSMMGFKKIGFFDTKPVIKNGANINNTTVDVEEDDEYYEEQETKVYESIQKYYNSNPTILDNQSKVVVTIDELRKDGYLDSLNDKTGSTCKGYAVILNGTIVTFNVYINCPNYSTNGYEEGNE